MNENNASREPSEKDKREYFEEHFLYEVRMLLYSFEQLVTCQNVSDVSNRTLTQVSTPWVDQFWGQSRNGNAGNMALETFLLHARNLREFFYTEPKFPDDARAFHFFPDKNSWEKLRPNETASIEDVKKRANKEMAHLTYKRISGTPPNKNWNYGKILTDLLAVIKVFLDGVPKKYLGKHSMEVKSELEQLLSHI
jgi:hypothetical protein